MRDSTAAASSWPLRVAHIGMATCLGIMALGVFINVVLRYGFGSGIAASEELARLLFVWMVFIGATAAYPLGEHMAFTSLIERLQSQPITLALATMLIRVLVLCAALLLAHGAWHQVSIGWSSTSVVMGYPVALLPLPALLSSVAIAVCALCELILRKPLLGNRVEVE
jgi:TRAP-type transport system small permease protein